MIPSIIKVVPVEQVFSITWMLGPRCNYDCMYCPPEWHDKHTKHRTLTELKDAWISIFEKSKHLALPYKISFSGGEATSNKYFIEFVEWLKDNYSDKIKAIILSTNGSATVNYYKKLLSLVDNITFSAHSEHIDEQKFFSMLAELRSSIPATKFIHVNIMNEFWNQDRIPQYVEFLQEHGISHSVNEIDYTKQTRDIPIFKGKLNLFHAKS